MSTVVDVNYVTTKPHTDDPWSNKDHGDGSFGQGAAHTIEIYKIPKMIPTGEPNKIINGVTWVMSKESDTEFEYEVDIVKHHATCDALPYGQECSLDDYLCHDGWREMLEAAEFSEGSTEPLEGFWKVRVCWEKSFVDSYHHYGWEYDSYLEWERTQKPEELK